MIFIIAIFFMIVSYAVGAKLKNKFKKVAFFATFGAAAEDVFYIMEKLSKNKSIANLEVQDRQIVIGEHNLLIKEFCNKIRNKTN